ncbi:MAG: dTDP-4-amino-4,6-dideoxygalactose transaminase [Gammaproteobacteria bacterium]|nr:dTDP-4-amino-4,6-dideoxygalactose transaminase [Gammaproteobacteria bacterium]
MVDTKQIGFNKPYLTGKEIEYIQNAVTQRKLSGNGKYTQSCHEFFKNQYAFKNCLLTTSCTDALEMAALLLNIQPGDEVIMPSFTFVSTANAFVLRGAKIVFVDSRADHPGIDEQLIEDLITPKTKVIVVVHYAGVACDMDVVMEIAKKSNLYVIEDAAQAIDSFYKGRPLGSIGHLAAFSFHETKNIISGEGGMLVINDGQFAERAEIIWEKGTNRSAFWRGEVDKYGWVDQGSSFLPSEIIAAFLLAQLENLRMIQERRLQIWKTYDQLLRPAAIENGFLIPDIPEYASNNAHMYYLICESGVHRGELIAKLGNKGINAVFHYQSLHSSPYYSVKHDGRKLPHSDRYSECLVRLPFYYELTKVQIKHIVNAIVSSK